MRLLALETDIERAKRKFISQDEKEVATIFRHGFFFVLSTIYQLIITAILITAGILIAYADFPFEISTWTITTVLFVIWLLFAFPNFLKTYLDWKYDFILVTTDKIVWVEQSSIFHQKVKQMNLENVASVSAETQFWNIFPFGSLHFDLKEGMGHAMEIRFIPQADQAAALISNICTQFERRRMYSHMPNPPSNQPMEEME
ncbi:hypothetical protein COU77_03085 [Candidatus Peregrinibacteria bacterium CG10_big_fil_rev_8_21_14_0_10_49_16]|nr:MAG: hypothetical protein COW95_02600 [Candidatus Peregrinibacteria bacterium CG22_combo_CG10-13_8_21_14_all_49_11]PIR52018.1 MAG: hypothetical protein COU77_03085 [Candidatus Peregrinibacteria bacterium CG10_big_fil_rev_8_21_14_0_10_49_16]